MLLTRHTIASNSSHEGCGHDSLPFLSTFFFSSQFFLLRSSTDPQPRRLMDYAHPEPPWAGSRFSPLPPVLLDTAFLFRFTVYTPSLLLPCFLCSFGRHLVFMLGLFHWALYCLERFQSTMPHAGASDRFWRFRAQLPKSPPQQPAVERLLR
jgi:hypothetical protein